MTNEGGRVGGSTDGAADRQVPEVSAVICTRNRGEKILRSVESVLANTGVTFELLIVDQSTEAQSRRALEHLATDPRVRHLKTDSVGIGLSRHIAVLEAASELIAFTDDDCFVPENWLRTVVETFGDNPEAAMVYFNVLPVAHDRSAGFIPSYERRGDHLVTTMRGKCRARGIGAAMALRRSAALAVGSFDPALGSRYPGIVGEEGDLAVKLILKGYGVLETDRMAVLHDGFRSWEDGRRLTERNFTGIGMVCAKPLRCGHWRSIVVTLYEGVGIALLLPLSSVLHGRRPRGIRAFPYFWAGFLRGLRAPVDRRQMNFEVEEPTKRLIAESSSPG